MVTSAIKQWFHLYLVVDQSLLFRSFLTFPCVCVCCVLHSAPCQEILLWYFGNSELPVALSTLQQLCAIDGGAGGVAPGFHFTPGSDGGAQLTPSETIR